MKKILYSTTALAAAGMLAFSANDAMAAKKPKPMSIKVGGFMKTMIGVSQQDSSFESSGTNNISRTGYDAFNIVNDSELSFTGSVKLDNGITSSVVIQIETDHRESIARSNSVDESYMKLTGGFGDIRIGSTKKAGFVLKHGAPNVGAIRTDTPDSDAWIIQPGNSAVGTPIAGGVGTNVGGADQMGLIYITPKFSNFRVGVTYIPSQTNGDFMPATGGSGGTESQFYGSMVSWEGKMGSSSVKADVGYSETHGTQNASFKQIRGGINIGIGGVTIGSSYADQNDIDTGKSGTANSDDGNAWDIGVSFKAGAVTLGATYWHAELPLASATNGDDEVSKYMLGASLGLGPGVTGLASLMYADWSDESTSAADNNKGWALIGGVQVRF